MSTYSQPQPVADPTNGLAIAGFVCSLVGLLSGGLLSPVGLILSLIGLNKPGGRGFAIAGVILGALGTCGGVIVFIFFSAIILAAVGLAAVAVSFAAFTNPVNIELTSDMARIAIAVEQFQDEQGYLPADLTGLGLSTPTLLDPWGNSYRYILTQDDQGYDIITNGEDGSPGSTDDHSFSKLDEVWGQDGNFSFDIKTDNKGGVQFKFGDKTIDIASDEDGGGVTIGDETYDVSDGSASESGEAIEDDNTESDESTEEEDDD